MALQKDFQTRYGVGGNYINFDPQIKDKITIILRMKYWISQDVKNTGGTIPLNDQITGSGDDRIIGFKCLYECKYDLDSTLNVFQQGYDYLKTLSEFLGSVDC